MEYILYFVLFCWLVVGWWYFNYRKVLKLRVINTREGNRIYMSAACSTHMTSLYWWVDILAKDGRMLQKAPLDALHKTIHHHTVSARRALKCIEGINDGMSRDMREISVRAFTDRSSKTRYSLAICELLSKLVGDIESDKIPTMQELMKEVQLIQEFLPTDNPSTPTGELDATI